MAGPIKTKTSSFGTVSRRGHDSKPFYAKRLYAELPAAKQPGASDASDTLDASLLEKTKKNIKSARKTVGGKSRQPASSVEKTQQLPQPQDVGRIERGALYCRDSRDMRELADESVGLMITSPPYNVGKEYDEDLSLGEYTKLLRDVFGETWRVLEVGGRACINIANIGRKPYIPLHAMIIEMMRDLGYVMRGEIIWDKDASAGSSCAWGSWRSAANPVLRDLHEYILVYSKEDLARAHSGESTIGKEDFLMATRSVWRFPAASARRLGHPAPFPEELPRRLIELYSFKDDLVLDPFVGSGTTCLTAARNDRRYVGYDVSAEYISLAQKRLDEWGEQAEIGLY